MRNWQEIFADQVAPAATKSESPSTGFLAVQGTDYNREFMVAGRAVNGWSDAAISKHEASDPTARVEFAEKVAESVCNVKDFPGCPMKWVADSWHIPHGNGNYCTNRSAFWRVTRRLIGALKIWDPAECDWSSKLAYSNLYKLSPKSGGNPSDRLARAQFEGCVELMRSELEIFAPYRLVLATGYEWASPFLDRLGFQSSNYYSDYVERVGQVGSTIIVVACHPMRKKEAKWVNEVGNAFRTMSY